MPIPRRPDTTSQPKIVWKSESRFEPQPASSASFASDRDLARSDLSPFVAVRESAWRRLWGHAKSARVEVGGVFVGEVFSDPKTEQLLVDVQAAIPARGAVESGVYFRLTEEAWDHISRERDHQFPSSEFPNHLIVGWYHTHPGLGVFYSATDRASQKAFFTQPWNFGIVVDPLQDRFGIFLGGDSKILPSEHIATYHDLKPLRPAVSPPLAPKPEPLTPPAQHDGGVPVKHRSVPPAPAIAGVVALLLVLWIAHRTRGAALHSVGTHQSQVQPMNRRR
jgi:proteasome lid subunit RPN8/RPN11